MCLFVTQYGAEVLSVDSAVEMLANLVSVQPNLFITDIGMPEVDGYSLIQPIRALPAEKGRQVAAIERSAYARDAGVGTYDRVPLPRKLFYSISSGFTPIDRSRSASRSAR